MSIQILTADSSVKAFLEDHPLMEVCFVFLSKPDAELFAKENELEL